MDKFVSIIVPTYHDWGRLALCLKALASQSYPKEEFEVIIVNNDPADVTPQDFYLPENFTLIAEPKPGSYAARNAGLRLAKGEIIGFTDSDCIPDKDWIKNAVDYFKDNKSCSRIAGNIIIFSKFSKATAAENYDKLVAFRQKSYVVKYGNCVTANLFSYKYVFTNIGLFDDAKMSYGDLIWGIKAHKNGYRIDYVENVIVNHPARDFADLVKKEKRLAGGRVKSSTKKQNRLVVFARFINEARPRFRGDIKRIGKIPNLTPLEKLSILLIKFRLNYVRAYETMELKLGKKPNRE